MKKPAKLILAVTAVGLAVLAFDGVSAIVRERRVGRVQLGMQKAQVEKLLGPGKPDISSDGVDHRWPTNREQYAYEANPSIWYGRWEDSLIIGYTNNTVSDIERCGL